MSAKIWHQSALRCVPMALALLGASATGCGTLFPAPQPQQTADSGAQPDDGGDLGDTPTVDANPQDTAVADAAAAETTTGETASGDSAIAETSTPDSAGPDVDCSCPQSQVMRDGACVPNPLVGCTLPCLGKAPSACPSQSVCDEGAAHQPCAPELLAPACVPQQAMGFAAGNLRITPTTAGVGEETSILAMGGDFYIGALMWWMRVGGETMLGNEYGAKCTLTGTFKPSSPGVYAVEVGYGGGPSEGMNQGWALAGFIGVGDVKLGVQPGFLCASTDVCASAGEWTCGCASGRCACEKAP